MDLSNIQVKVKMPYPTIEITNVNNVQLKVLHDLIAGDGGELDAIFQYFYISSITRTTDEEIADIFEEMSLVEIQHLDMLMEAIIKSKGVPSYTDSRNRCFFANRVNYSQDLHSLIDYCLKEEQNSINNYNLAIEMVEDKSLKQLFLRIIEDEKKHLEVLKSLQWKLITL